MYGNDGGGSCHLPSTKRMLVLHLLWVAWLGGRKEERVWLYGSDDGGSAAISYEPSTKRMLVLHSKCRDSAELMT